MPSEFQKQLKTFQRLPAQDGRRAAFLFVRDLQYGDIGSRNPLDVLKAGKGTCSGKHALLRLFLEAMGYEVQTWFARHDFRKFPITPWPEELHSFQSKTLTDYHDFLKVNVDGMWLTVDAIFDKATEPFGFPVADWDGVSDMRLPVKAEEIFPAQGDPEEFKKALIGALPAQVQKDRKEFLAALTGMLDGRRAM